MTDDALQCFARLCRDVPWSQIMDRAWLRRAFDAYAAIPPFDDERVSPNDGSRA